jgi:hypothetical protein
VPKDHKTKYDLLNDIARHFKRNDLLISPVESGEPKNLVLETLFAEKNKGFWTAAGYPESPSIDSLLAEFYSDWSNREPQKPN